LSLLFVGGEDNQRVLGGLHQNSIENRDSAFPTFILAAIIFVDQGSGFSSSIG
jgi:hypothetical protein